MRAAERTNEALRVVGDPRRSTPTWFESPSIALEPLPVDTPLRSNGARLVARVADVVLAFVGCLLVLVPALLIAALVRASSRGPVLFRQRRVGLHGAEFNVYKFRTMREGADREVMTDELLHHRYRSNGFKLPPDDPRITTVGRVLRKTSADEIPQLLNVLAGDMSIVGVRPLLAEELALRPNQDQELYKQLRPGMTGLWQVEGRSTVAGIDRVALDRRYLHEWSIRTNLRILIRTPLAVLRGSGAH